MLASRHQSFHLPSSHLLIPDQQQQQHQHWTSNTIILQPPYNHNNITTATLSSNTFPFGADQPLFDFQPHHFNASPSMHTESANHSWLSNGQLTPTSTTRAHHHRESSLSSLGSAGPASPYTATTSNPQVAGDIYHDFHDFQQPSSKPLTPVHTPSQEHFLASQYSNFYHTSNLGYTMGSDGMPKQVEDAALMAAPELNNNNNNRHPGRRPMASVASHESPSTPPSYEEERQRNGETSKKDFFSDDYLLFNDQGFRNDTPKLHRTMTDAYADELYNPSFQITTAPHTQAAVTNPLSPQNDVFSQRLQAANNQHLSASNTHIPLAIPSRDRSPFRQGSPLAPSVNSFGPLSPSMRLGTATHMREQQKAENDARAIQRQFERTSPEQTTPKTISPKDVDLVYQESEEDSNMPLFPPPPPPPQRAQQQRQSPHFRQQTAISQDTSALDDSTASQQSYGSMATSRRESSSASASAFSAASQAAQQQQQGNYNFATPSRQMQVPQQYPFVPQLQTHRQASGLSAASEEFPATLTSMESSSSEYALEPEPEPESEMEPSMGEIKKPSRVSADTGTYTCTYHGCTLRFDTPAKLQRHKREGHRSSASVPESGNSGSGSGMTSEAQRNSQAGPHKCERINPSTGKPCNTIFSRPYDLTRHEDTIHNARKQKVHCPLCTEEKSFSRNDALTRHLRVVHPEHVEMSRSRRRGGHDS
ncbi:Transcriptional regulator [Lachnellula occidentalis]|uniref:Transcriptional regulator n=1 Tax=Lachnellula occidentalis TaxID=215460 RepID=A0A8H8UAA9_9HELO|nr:Transcriptional regulator [Lachnellula occidentalis]